MRYLASISYDGSKFYGFQKLNNYYTVQGELERVLGIVNKKFTPVKGAGRTDRGVHAYSQGISFDLDVVIPTDKLAGVLNKLLDNSVHINSVCVVNDDFHPRFDAIKKEYEYVINLGIFDPIINDYVYNLNKKLDIKSMKRAAKLFVGFHSYKAFTSGERESYNSVIYKIKFKRCGDFLTISFVGKSFYRYMVRNIVGSLIDIGLGKLDIKSVKFMLDNEKRGFKYNTAPACGLYLVKVYY